MEVDEELGRVFPDAALHEALDGAGFYALRAQAAIDRFEVRLGPDSVSLTDNRSGDMLSMPHTGSASSIVKCLEDLLFYARLMRRQVWVQERSSSRCPVPRHSHRRVGTRRREHRRTSTRPVSASRGDPPRSRSSNDDEHDPGRLGRWS
jgi:hypothetical protein